MILIAYWRQEKDHSDDPDLIYWADGSPATLNDYRLYGEATYTCIGSPDSSMQMIMFPDLFARVVHDPAKGTWIAQPFGADIDLEIDDPIASDWNLLSEVSTLPIVYRIEVNRDEPV